MSKPKLSLAEKAVPQKTDAERLKDIGNSLERMAEGLGKLHPHLTDLGNLLYERQDSSAPGEGLAVIQAAEILLEEYAGDVETFRGWAEDLAAEARGVEGGQVEAK